MAVPSAAITGHLVRHGVPASAARTVTGGYGHSRLREVTLGGVTRSLLHHMTVPVLFFRQPLHHIPLKTPTKFS